MSPFLGRVQEVFNSTQVIDITISKCLIEPFLVEDAVASFGCILKTSFRFTTLMIRRAAECQSFQGLLYCHRIFFAVVHMMVRRVNVDGSISLHLVPCLPCRLIEWISQLIQQLIVVRRLTALCMQNLQLLNSDTSPEDFVFPAIRAQN